MVLASRPYSVGEQSCGQGVFQADLPQQHPD